MRTVPSVFVNGPRACYPARRSGRRLTSCRLFLGFVARDCKAETVPGREFPQGKDKLLRIVEIGDACGAQTLAPGVTAPRRCVATMCHRHDERHGLPWRSDTALPSYGLNDPT